MGVFSRTMLMLTMAWLVGLTVVFVIRISDPEPSWREKFVAEANIRRALAYRYVDIMGGTVGNRGALAGNDAETQLDPESLGAAPYGMEGESGGGLSADGLAGSQVRKSDSLLQIEKDKGTNDQTTFEGSKKDLANEIIKTQGEIADYQRKRREADARLAQVRENARTFAAKMQAFRYIIASIQQKVFNIDYEIQRVMIERDALAVEYVQVQNDIARIDKQTIALEDRYYDLAKSYDKTVKTVALYEQMDPALRRMADTAGRGWLRGRVMGVGDDPRTGVVSISIGTNEGVEEQQVFSIYRNGEFLGRMRVESVSHNSATGRLMEEFRGRVMVLENDLVRTAQPFGGNKLK